MDKVGVMAAYWSTFKYFIILIVCTNSTLCISWIIKCLIGYDNFSWAHFGLSFLVLFYQHRRTIFSCSNKGFGIKTECYDHVFFHGSTAIVGHGLLIIEALQPHTPRHTTFGRTPRDEWSDRRRDLYLTAHKIKRQTATPPAGFEPAILTSEWAQTHTLDGGHRDRRVLSPEGAKSLTQWQKINPWKILRRPIIWTWQ